MKLALMLSLLPMFGFGMDRLAALSMIETGNNDRMVGDAGEISRYQILKSEWHSVTNSTRYSDARMAHAVALKLIASRVGSFRAIYRREPTHFEFYGLWNAPGQVLKGRVSRTVAERCRRYSNLCQIKPAPEGIAGMQLAMAN